MKNEWEKLKYYFSNYNVQVINDIKDLNYVSEFLRVLHNYDEPDFYADILDTVFIMEHFEFDSTKNSNTGSQARKEIARVERKFNSIPASEEIKLFHDKINSTSCSEYYIDNAIKQFQRHYYKIDNYINKLKSENIIKKKTTIKICFYIEDVSILGNHYYNYNNDQIQPINLFFCDKFLDIFQYSIRIDYAFCVSIYKPDLGKFWFISRQDIDEYRKRQIDIQNIEIFNPQPMINGFNVKIPKQ